MPPRPELPRSSFQVTSEASCTDICSLHDFPWSRVLDSGPGFPLLTPQGPGERESAQEGTGKAAPANSWRCSSGLRDHSATGPSPVPAHSRSPEMRLPKTGTWAPFFLVYVGRRRKKRHAQGAAYTFCGGRLCILLPSGWLTPQMYNESGTCTLIKNDKRSSH